VMCAGHRWSVRVVSSGRCVASIAGIACTERRRALLEHGSRVAVLHTHTHPVSTYLLTYLLTAISPDSQTFSTSVVPGHLKRFISEKEKRDLTFFL